MSRVHRWSKSCPDNFLSFFKLLRGEWAGLNNNLTKALTLFDEAADIAANYQCLEYNVLAYHRAFLLCIRKKNSEKASFYLNKAIYAYDKWGALGVVAMLKEKYSNFI